MDNMDLADEDVINLTLEEIIKLNAKKNKLKQEREELEKCAKNNLTHGSTGQSEKLPVHMRLGWSTLNSQRKPAFIDNFLNLRAKKSLANAKRIQKAKMKFQNPNNCVKSFKNFDLLKRTMNSSLTKDAVTLFDRINGIQKKKQINGSIKSLGRSTITIFRHSIKLSLNPIIQRKLANMNPPPEPIDESILMGMNYSPGVTDITTDLRCTAND